MRAFKHALVALLALVSCVLGLEYRLPTSVIPENYDITIKPYLLDTDGAKQFTFDGEVNITLHANVANIREITLHKDYIDIEQTRFYDKNDNLVQTIGGSSLEWEQATDKLTVRLENAMRVGENYTLHFVYQGKIRDGMAGFFRANYTDANNVTQWMAITQLQRIDARTLFPCFDEPAFKAKFRMHVNRATNNIMSLFNTQLVQSTPDNAGRTLDRFDWTPPMSTYLVALMIGRFDTRASNDFYSVKVRPELAAYTEFSYDVTLKTIAAYDAYTKLPYQSLGNPILQNAGSPKFPHNGMENWGLTIYRDSVLVHTPGYTDGWSDKEYTITILVHETAHMWFGNSVTFSWWSYFWLNEAFARYYQYYLAHEIYPEYQLDQQFVVNQVHLIFGIDAVNTTQPMTSPEGSIASPSQIASKFSSIAYAKGASIVRMFRNIMGKDNFDNAIRDYLRTNHLKNTKPDDLFTHLTHYWPSAPALDLPQFFHDWTEQVGFPVLHVTVFTGSILFEQKRFLLDPTDGSDPNLLYIIPITYTTNLERNFQNLTPKYYLGTEKLMHNTKDVNSISWIIFNIQQSNYYRVHYDDRTLNNIKMALSRSDHSNIHVINRAQLVDDLFNFGRVNMMDYADVFKFIEYMQHEIDYLPWYAAFSGLTRIAQRLTVQQQKNFTIFLTDISAQAYKKISLIDDNVVLDVYLRNRVMSWLCRYHHDDCNRQTRAIFDNTIVTGVKPIPDYREIVYCSACRDGIFAYYTALDDWFAKETLASEKEMLMRAMACTRHFYEYHYMRILSGLIPQEYRVTALTPMYTQNYENVTPVFGMIISTVERLAAALGGYSNVASVINSMADYFTTVEQQKMLEDLIVEKGTLFGSSVATLNSAVQKVETNLKWAEQRLPKLLLYLAERNGGNAITGLAATTLFIIMGLFHVILL